MIFRKKQHDWDTVKDVSRAVVADLMRLIPECFVIKSGGKSCVGKIFIDYLRNELGANTVASWSARARQGLGQEAWAGYAKSACGLA